MMCVNEIKISGTVVPGSVTEEYDEKFDWWCTYFSVEGVHCCNDYVYEGNVRKDKAVAVECYTSLSKTKAPVHEGDNVIIEGVMCISHDMKGVLRANVQVHNIYIVAESWGQS